MTELQVYMEFMIQFLFFYLNSQEGKWAEDENEVIWQNILAEQ